MANVRMEHDFLGDREVPADAYYGVQTLRGAENFPITGLPLHPALIRAMALAGRLWIAWRPGAAPPLDEVFVRQAALEHGLVDDRRAEVLPGWTGLRLRWRSRPRVERPAPRA